MKQSEHSKIEFYCFLLQPTIRFMYFSGSFIWNSKPIHFWKLQTLGNPKNNVAICTEIIGGGHLGFQNGRHVKSVFWQYLSFQATWEVNLGIKLYVFEVKECVEVTSNFTR